MNMAVRIKRPQIAPGVHLDDVWAGKIVDQMLEALRHDRDTAFDTLEVAMKRQSANIANPAGQKRILKALCDSLGPRLLAPFYEFGKRKKFSIQLDEILPSQGGLLCSSTHIRGVGPNRDPVVDIYSMVFFTRHALVRLVQRCGCRSVQDLLGALRYLWPRLLYATWASDYGRYLPKDKPGWILPAGSDEGALIGVPMIRGQRGIHPAAVVVPTVLAPYMVSQAGLAPLDLMLESMTRVYDSDDENVHALRVLFEASPAHHKPVN